MSLPLPLTPGTVVGGHYIIDALINSGGFGAVYRGTDTSERNRPCAIKETYDVSPAARRQALMEASVLFTIKSRNLPQVYDALEANGRFYLVMQLIEGPNLLQLKSSRRGPCSEQEVVEWMVPIMGVLQELHSRNPAIIHRDIKPSNIILTRDQTAVLVDFGLTKLYEPGNSTQTIIKAVSEGFSPVEQYLGNTSPQSDIYALAATMYFLLTDTLPSASINRSVNDLLISPRQLNPSLSPKIERVLLKALAVDADQRYQSMSEFIMDIKQSGFNAYGDQTISGNSGRYSTTVNVNTGSRSKRQTPPAGNNPGPFEPTARPIAPPPPPIYYQPKPAPTQTQSPPAIPNGYVLVPQSALIQQPLPSAFGQGCLWGLLQGILAAILLLALKKDLYFYVGMGMGILFYIWGGFRTTRKGGAITRGGWAGVWAGITSTVLFWFTIVVGLVILISQRVQADNLKAQQDGYPLPTDELQRATDAILPHIFKQSQTTAQQQTQQGSFWTLAIPILIALLVAFSSGLIGGVLGRSSFNKRIRNMSKRRIA